MSDTAGHGPTASARMSALRQDIKYTLRSLRKHPGFAALVILTLAAGIGAATAMFSVANGVLLRPLPVREQERLVVGWRDDALRGGQRLAFSEAMLNDYAAESRTFQKVSTMSAGPVQRWPMVLNGEVFFGNTFLVGGDYFETLGVSPMVGRRMTMADDNPGAGMNVVLSHAFWQRKFGGDPAAVGKTIRFVGRFHTIIGVMPPEFDLPATTDIWVPKSMFAQPGQRPQGQFLALVGRLKPGITPAAARAEFDGFVRRKSTENPAQMPNARADVRSLADYVVGDVRQAVVILLAASALLLVIACINVANLLLIRGAAREQELAVRTALGAGKGRLARQLLTESLVLGVAGGAAGVVLAALAVRVLVAAAPPELPRLDQIHLDGRVLAVAVAVSIVCALAFGLAPAMWAWRTDLGTPLRGGGRGGSDARGARSAKRLLAAGQVALAFIVLAGAGLLGNSLVRLLNIEVGFRPERLTSMFMIVSAIKYPLNEPKKLQGMLDQALQRIGQVQGVSAVTATTTRPMAGLDAFRVNFVAEGQTAEAAGGNPMLMGDAIGPEHFRTIGVPLLRGRTFTDADRDSTPRVAILSQDIVKQLWPNEDPLGRRIRFGTAADTGQLNWLTVVGVAGNSRFRDLTTPAPTVYVPYKQIGAVPLYLLVRSNREQGALVPAVLAALHEVEPDSHLPEASSVEQIMSRPLARPRFNALLLAMFAGAALLLAAVGIYGLMSSLVGQRTREVGIRMALGARPSEVRGLVLKEGMVLSAAGAIAGLVVAVIGSRAIAALLFEVKPGDPVTMLIAGAVLLVVAVIACYIPARRAARVDPIQALR
ncbi:MAG TPA: ABC transporter permease [Gemmatimonadaceae bacterium]|nr:ABC transporter permease [Gemmatimonadaceae bacterium]